MEGGRRSEKGRLTRQIVKNAITSVTVAGIVVVAGTTTAVARFSMIRKAKAKATTKMEYEMKGMM